MAELKLGKMTSREIAEWMEITYGSYRRNKNQRLEYLKNFADFEEIYGGVIIKEILIPKFLKNISEEDQYYINAIKETTNGLATIAGITRKLKAEIPEFEDVSEKTLYRRMSNAGNRTFGKTADDNSKGTHGIRHYIWAIKVSDFNVYRFISPEEETIYKRIRDAYCKEKAEVAEKEALLRDAYKKKEITAEEYAEQSCGLDFFGEVLSEFKAETGLQLVRTTEHELYESWLNFCGVLD